MRNTLEPKELGVFDEGVAFHLISEEFQQLVISDIIHRFRSIVQCNENLTEQQNLFR